MGDVEGHELGVVVEDFAGFGVDVNGILDRVKALLLLPGLLDVEHFVFQVGGRDSFVVQDVAAEVGVDVAVMIRGDDARAVQSRVEVIVFLEVGRRLERAERGGVNRQADIAYVAREDHLPLA